VATPILEATKTAISGFYPIQLASAIRREAWMNNIIYIVGLVVVVLAVLSFFGLR
jgi:hypothetical protein